MKKNFRALQLVPMQYIGPCLCTRCGKEYDSRELIYGVSTKGHRDGQLYPRWYCPTEDCNGHLNSGVYYRTVST